MAFGAIRCIGCSTLWLEALLIHRVYSTLSIDIQIPFTTIRFLFTELTRPINFVIK